ncbi:DUF6090 family protein [Eudoraea adriatica]|uniref:DUF6090 family protein n=1 Tax=Eudoraea adriatica TaxID=446681 RepID=UPI00036FAAC9|nr:DUF6090 family protein [Eudoraea adriatica]
MINFFRKIRQQLLNQNKVSKYLLYAIGEVVLVVVGILIALQINNWNEGRKSDKVELKILQELHAVLKGGAFPGELEFQKGQIEANEKSKASCELILRYFQDNLPYQDSLKSHFANAHTRYIGQIKSHAYENAKNYGLGFIGNDSLKELLTWAYETNSAVLEKLYERNNLYEYGTVVPVITELFESINMNMPDNTKEMIPLNYQSLKGNTIYANILQSTIHKRNEIIFFQDLRYQRMLKIATFLEEEIELKKGKANQ